MPSPASNSTRQRIIGEATRLFAAQGIKATTVAQIERAVGLRPGSGGVHRHFATKNDLVRAVLDAQLETGANALTTAKGWPQPTPDQVPEYLEAIGRFALEQANESREVALIMLRDAHNLPDGLLDEHHAKNFELVYASTAEGLRALQQQSGGHADLDPDALAFLLMAPLIYYRVIEWATHRRVLDIDEDRLVTAWSKVFAPVIAPFAVRDEAEPDTR